MWYLVQYIQDRQYGVIEAPSLNSISTRLLRDQPDGCFGVTHLSNLTCVEPEASDFDWPLAKWLKEANVAILESFESDDPLTDLPNLFPEYYL